VAQKKSNRRSPRRSPTGGGRSPQPEKAQAPAPGKKKAERASARSVAAKKKQQRQTIYIWGALGIVFLAVVAISVFAGGNSRTGVAEAQAWDLPAFGPGTESTDRVTLAESRGKPTVVNFFASWCIECDRELPHFASISEELRDEVNFVGVVSAESGNPLYMPERHGVDWWPLARDIGPTGNDLAISLGMRPGAMPLTAFYDADGNLLTTNPGAISEAALRSNISTLYGIEF
jgi:thiol-disulfide isomerase/thioredoxin